MQDEVFCLFLKRKSHSSAEERLRGDSGKGGFGMKHYFIINPAAGKGAAVQLTGPIRAACEGRGVEYHIHVTAAPGEAADYVSAVCRQLPEESLRFYACGGDGTVGPVWGSSAAGRATSS